MKVRAWQNGLGKRGWRAGQISRGKDPKLKEKASCCREGHRGKEGKGRERNRGKKGKKGMGRRLFYFLFVISMFFLAVNTRTKSMTKLILFEPWAGRFGNNVFQWYDWFLAVT